MQHMFKPGDTKTFERVVRPEDTAAFEGDEVHPVYATFALARDAEWVCRLFVLDMKDADEEGIGTFVTVNHKSPALVGATVTFKATVLRLEANELVCHYEATCGGRVVAVGEQGQKVLKKEKLRRLFETISS